MTTADVMGQTSSQPGSPRLSQEPEANIPKKRKGKKSKSKKLEQNDGIADSSVARRRAALEEESARALMQLSGSALHHDHDTRAPYYVQGGGGDPQTSAHDPEGQRSEDVVEVRKAPTKKKTTSKSKKSRGSHGKEKRAGGDDLVQRTSPVHDVSASPPPTHPLDHEASDNELVQEYEAALPQRRGARGAKASKQFPVDMDDRGTEEASEDADEHCVNGKSLPHKEDKTKHKGPSKKRKRNTAHADVHDVRGSEMPLDPELPVFSALSPSIDPYSMGDTENFQLTGYQSGNRYKRRRVEQPQHAAGEGYEAENGYDLDSNHNGPQDQVVRGLEDEMDQFTRGACAQYAEHADMDDLQRQAQSENDKSKQTDKATSNGKHGFSADETIRLDRFRDQYCKANDMPLTAFNHFVQSNLRANEQVVVIFNAIQELFPYRSRSSVQRFCRRRYHNFHARGVWTPEEDADLKAAVASKGTSWKVIGEQLGRFSEDCRDRYRNYLAPSAENRNKDAWTESEVVNLSHSILECMQRMKHDRQVKNGQNAGHPVPVSDSDSDQEAEDLKLINWQTVSDLMGSYGTARSRIQCSFKWSKIKKADRGRYLQEIKEAKSNLRNLERGNYTANNMKKSTGWRLKAASKQVKNMKSGDKYDLLNAILDSAAPKEENIPWRVIGDDGFRRRWSFSERKAGWLMLKEQIEGSEHMDYRQIIHQLLADLLSHGVSERFNIDVHGLAEGSPVKRPRHARDKHNVVTNGETRLQALPDEQGDRTSNQPIHDSGQDKENVEEPTTQGDSRPHGRSASPNSLFDDAEEPPTGEAALDPLLHDDASMWAQNPAAAAEISPELATQIQTHLLQAV